MGRLPLSTMISSYTLLTAMNGDRLQVQTAHCHEVDIPGVVVETLVACICLAVI